MQNNRLKLSALLLLGLVLKGLQAQTSVNTTGGNASGNGGSASYSVGQITCQNQSGTSGSIAQGVQQAFEITVINSIEQAKSIILKYSVYPNPTKNYLTLEVKDVEPSTLTVKLYDMNGKLLRNDKITGVITNIVMSNLVPSTYFLKIIQTNQVLKTFKIIKK